MQTEMLSLLRVFRTPINILTELLQFILIACLRLARYPYLIQQASYKIDQKGVIKLSKRLITTYLIIFFAFSSVAGLFLFNPFGTKETQAAWFNDNWAYRQKLPISTHSASENNVYNEILLDALPYVSSGKFQADCDDLRFTKENGEILPYQFIGGCPGSGAGSGGAADVQIDDSTEPGQNFTMHKSGIVWTSSTTGYYFILDDVGGTGVGRVSYKKTTDSGQTWAADVDVSTVNTTRFSVWFDQETSGDSGTKIHIAYNDHDNDRLYYRNLDTSNDTLGTEINIAAVDPFADANLSYFTSGFISITKARGGNLYIFGFFGNDTNAVFYRSTDGGANWTSRSTTNLWVNDISDANNLLQLIPAADTDNQDIAAVVLDDVGTDLKFLLYDDSGDSWGNSTIIDSAMTTGGDWFDEYWGFDVAVRHSDNKAIIAYWNSYISSTADMEVAELTLTAAGAASSAKTNIATNQADSGESAVFIDNNTDDIYVAYLQTPGTAFWSSNDVKYKKSTDGGTTWGSAVQVNTTTRSDTRMLSTVSGIKSGSGGRYMPVWDDFGNNDVYTNYGSSVIIPVQTVIRIGFDTMPTAPFNIYMYYGNPSASAASETLSHSACGNGCAEGTFGSEEKGPAPTLYWKFNEGQGTAAEDGTTNGLDGTLNNTPTYQTENMCVDSKCLWFDGENNENVSRADSSSLDFGATDNFTVGAWVKRNGTSSAISYIISKHDTTDDSEDGGYKLWMDADGDLCFGIDDDITWGPDHSACSDAGADYDDDKWHYVVGVRDQTGTDKIYVYVDGNEMSGGGTTDSTSDTLANSNTFYVGVDRDGTSNEWLGFIDEVKVYPQALSAAQVKANFNARSNPEGVSVREGNNTQNMPGALSNGLIGYWKMDETSGNPTDSSGNGYTLTNTNTATFAAGKFGNAASLASASSQYFTVASNTNFVIGNNSRTFAAWVKLSSKGADRHIFGKWSSGLSNNEYGLYYNSTADRFRFEVTPNGASGSIVSADANDLGSPSTGVWYFVVGTYNFATGTVSIQVNNGAVNSTSGASTVFSGTNNLTIGSLRNSSPTNFWNGTIDEARIYNRALSSAEVSQLYNWAPGPVGYWKLDEPSGNTAYDSSGNGNDLTWTNTPTAAIGKYGKAINLAGSDQQLTRADDADFDFGTGSSFSYGAWVKHSSASALEMIIDKYDATAGNGGFKLQMESDGDLTCGIDDDETSFPEDSATSTAATYDDGSWHHVECVKDGTAGLYLYIDGSLIASDTSISSTGDFANADPLYVGIAEDGTSNDWVGQIDEPKIYSYARTAAQVIEDMNAGHPAPGSPVGTPVAYWKLDEGYSSTAHDSNSSTAGAEDLTLSSTAAWTNSGKFARAWNGDQTRWLSRADDDDLDFAAADDFTISLWFKSASATNPTQEYFVSKSRSSATQEQGYAILGEGLGLGLICFGIDDLSDAAWDLDDAVCSTSDLYDTNWHYIAATKTGTSRIDLYVDGVLISSDTSIATTGTLANGRTFYLGDYDGVDNGSELNGTLDEVKVYRSALTADQIKLDMNRGASQVLGALSDKSGNELNSAINEYCVPGDTTTCDSTKTPIGRWNFEERTGTTAFDISGNSYDGTLAGTTLPTWTTGKVGSGLAFSGSGNSRVTVNSSASVKGLTAYTLEAWVKFTTLSGTETVYGESTATSGAARLQLFADPAAAKCAGGKFGVSFRSDDADSLQNFCGNAAPVANTWYHLTFVFNSTTDVHLLYVNGILDSTYSFAATAVDSDAPANGISIGAFPTPTAFLIGVTDQIKLFNYARTPGQIAWDYNRGGPVAHWKMDECQGTTINDSAGNSLSGTLNLGAGGTTSAGTCTTSGSWFNGASGKRNYSLDFDGTDDYVSVSDNDKLDIAGSFTLSTWFNPDSLPASSTIGWLIGKLGDPDLDTAGTQANYELMLDQGTLGSGQGITVGFEDSSHNDYVGTYRSTLTTGQWYLLTGVFDDSANTLTLYINGQQVSQTTSVTGTPATSANALQLGESNNAGPFSAEDRIDGKMDDTRVYNYPLTAVQVKTLYNEGVTRYGPSTGAP